MQMLTSRQWAIGIVHAYPLFPVLETWMTCLAGDREDLTRDQLLARARLDDKEEDWQDLGRYVSFVCSKYMHDYVPMNTFLRPEQTQKKSIDSRTAVVSPTAIFGGV